MKDLDETIRDLFRARKFLQESQGRIARRNARRKVLGILQSVRNSVDSQYPVIQKDRPMITPLQRAVDTLDWRGFQTKKINIRAAWDPKEARGFNHWFCKENGLRELEIRFTEDFADPTCWTSWRGTLPGREEAIYILTGLSPKNSWRAVFHQLAHYRCKRHSRRAFTMELAEVLQSWKRYRTEIDRQKTVKRIARRVTSLRDER